MSPDARRHGTARLVEENTIGIYRYYASRGEGSFIDARPVARYESDIPITSLNALFSPRCGDELTDDVVSGELARVAARGRSAFWWLGDGGPSPALRARLEAHGLAPAAPMPGMVAEIASLPLDAPTPPWLSIEPMENPAGLADFLLVQHERLRHDPVVLRRLIGFNEALGTSHALPLRRYVGRVGARLVATSVLFLHGQTAGVYSVATHPGFRRRGIATAMTLASLRAAAAFGARYAVLEATAAGYPLYRRLGFSECARFHSMVFGLMYDTTTSDR